MVAATKNKYIDAETIVRQTRKRKGRPCAIPKENISFLTAGAMAGKTWRQTTNNYYQSIGLSLVDEVIGDKEKTEEIFTDGHKLRYAGVLEQFGRMNALYEKEKCTAEELIDYVEKGLELIKEGEKSKEIEQNLRTIRVNLPFIHFLKITGEE